MSYLLQFGSYVFPNTLRPASVSGDADGAGVAIPRAPGLRTQKPRRGPSGLIIRGDLTAPDAASLDTLVQQLRAATLGAGKQTLYYGTDARYYREAYCKSFSEDYREGITYGVLASFSITFAAEDFPEAYGGAPVAPALISGLNAITPQGDAHSLPTWSFTLSSAGAGIIEVSNAATNETMRILVPAGALSGQVITVNRETLIATRAGVADPALYRGQVPRLRGGALNNITVTLTTQTISAASVTYPPRWS